MAQRIRRTKSAAVLCTVASALTSSTDDAQFVAGDVPIRGATAPGFAALDAAITTHMETYQISAVIHADLEAIRRNPGFVRSFLWPTACPLPFTD